MRGRKSNRSIQLLEFISPSILATTEHIIQSCVTVQVENKDCSVTYFNRVTTLKALNFC